MSQSRISSVFEAVLNQLSGFVFSLIVWAYVVAPLYGFDVNWQQNFEITAMFTVLSVLRSYLWRRFFNSRCVK